MVKHRTFPVDRFLDKFQGHEALLKNFCRLWGQRLRLPLQHLTVEQFKQWLVDTDMIGAARDELMEALYRCHDLATEAGHEYLNNACREFARYQPDPEGELAVECLAIKVRTENEEAFNLAYDLHALSHAERFSIFRSNAPLHLLDPRRHKQRFEKSLARIFQRDKQSERVLVRCYEEGDYWNFIVYHEKRMKATLSFRGTKTRPRVAPTVFRPAQQDFLSFNQQTGQLEIEAAFESEAEKLRQCFAKTFLNDPQIYESAESADCLDLGQLARPSFNLDTPEGIGAALVQLRFKLPQVHNPSFDIHSKNILATLQEFGLRQRLRRSSIQAAVIKITFPDDKRGKRVELAGPNRIKLNRATHADNVFELLKSWKLLKADEKVSDTDHAAGADFGATARNGHAPAALSGRRTASRTKTKKPSGPGKPR